MSDDVKNTIFNFEDLVKEFEDMISKAEIGDMVQVGFGKTEKMLVKITKICGDRFEAKVEWLPRENPIKVGDGVMFSRNDILGSSIEIQQEKT